MNSHGAVSLDVVWQAVELSQTHPVRWPRNLLGEYATIAELIAAAARPFEAHNIHHEPHLSVLRR